MTARAPARRYIRVLHETLSHPKFIGLTAAERGTWQIAALVADIAYPSPIHESGVRLHVADASFERLYERRLLDACDDPGWFYLHDLEDLRVMPSDTPEATRARKAESRARHPVTNVTAVTSVTTDQTNETNETDTSSVLVRGHRARPRASAGGPSKTGMSRPFEVPA